MNRRVVVTGMSGVTAFGHDWACVEPRLKALENATRYMENYAQYEGLNTKLAAPWSILNSHRTINASRYAAWGASPSSPPSQRKMRSSKQA